MKLVIKADGTSDVGQLRSGNEDSFLLDHDHNLYAVADGMGGHAAGEVASRLAVEALKEAWAEGAEGESDDDKMVRGFSVANERIREEVERDAARHGMGTTLVAAHFEGGEARIANVGDSRAYVLRAGNLRQITTDHSWVREQLDSGKISAEEAANHPFRNVITRALGTRPQVEVDLLNLPLEGGDRLLLCSDGLTGMLEDEEITRILMESSDTQEAVARLVDEANEAGGEDNITVVLIECSE
jgi:protein phosphatase